MGFVLRHAFAALSIGFFVTSCTSAGPEKLITSRISFSNLPGWQQENHLEIVRAFAHGCGRFKGSRVADIPVSKDTWNYVCTAAKQGQTDNAKAWIEKHFVPHSLKTTEKQTGLLTGYFIPEIRGSMTQSKNYRYPVYGVPRDLKSGSAYHTRAEIDAGALEEKADVLLWVNDSVDLFFLHVQGSGRVRLDDGRVVQLQFAAKNGRAYTSIGKVLKQKGLLEPENISMQSIKAWLYKNPERANEILHENDSYIFFTLNTAAAMPKGAAGIPLMTGRSLAADPSQLPYGAFTYISTTLANGMSWNAAMMVLDTGSAIKGALRGDIFFGAGEKAAALAGKQNARGEWYLLLPR